jgi:cyclopropane-fatty-acyl-phospholipid synthase
VLEAYLRRAVEVGDLTVDEGEGRALRFGDGSGPPLAIRLAKGAALKIALNPELKLGECFMDGELVFERGSIYDLLALVARNPRFWAEQPTAWTRLRNIALRRLGQMNGRRAARRNVARHYDLSYDLYSRFLDPDLQYSCAYYAEPNMTLEAAQAAKKAHIAAKLRLPQTGRVLDIGCGWGGLALTLAHYSPEIEILGVTLSREQLAVAERRAQSQGVSGRVKFQLRDYRDVQGPFDRIVSVGMFEHVGRPHFQEFFDHAARLLAEDGVMLLHAIGRRTPPARTQPFIAKYIFPGGYIPSLSEVLPAIENAGLWVTDTEILRLHYAETLKAWRQRFGARRAEIAELYDERFCRMWEFYLVSSEAAFRWFGMMNFQFQLTKRVDALPITRDYMLADERHLVGTGDIAANEGLAAMVASSGSGALG